MASNPFEKAKPGSVAIEKDGREWVKSHPDTPAFLGGPGWTSPQGVSLTLHRTDQDMQLRNIAYLLPAHIAEKYRITTEADHDN